MDREKKHICINKIEKIQRDHTAEHNVGRVDRHTQKQLVVFCVVEIALSREYCTNEREHCGRYERHREKQPFAALLSHLKADNHCKTEREHHHKSERDQDYCYDERRSYVE